MLIGATKLSFVEAVYEHFRRCAFDAHSSVYSLFLSSVRLLHFVANKDDDKHSFRPHTLTHIHREREIRYYCITQSITHTMRSVHNNV